MIPDRDTPEDRAESISTRLSFHRDLLHAVRSLIGDGWDDFHRAAGVADDVFVLAGDDLYQVISQFWAEFPDPSPQIVRNCHAIYANLLFGMRRFRDVVEQKLDLMFDALEGRDQVATALWRFLRVAVWRAPPLAAAQPPPLDEATVDLIRTTSLGILGIPLVACNGVEFDLEPSRMTKCVEVLRRAALGTILRVDGRRSTSARPGPVATRALKRRAICAAGIGRD